MKTIPCRICGRRTLETTLCNECLELKSKMINDPSFTKKIIKLVIDSDGLRSHLDDWNVREKMTPARANQKLLLDELDSIITKGCGILGYINRIKEISQELRTV